MALLEHNLKVYNEAIEYFNHGGRDLLITQDTGTGKSYICIELLKTIFKDKRVLYVVPKWSIAENFKKSDGFSDIEDNVEFLSYAFFNSVNKLERVIFEYDVFIVDEAHHLGSNLNGRILLNLKSDTEDIENKYFIGLTATPERMDGVSVESYFSKVIQGITLLECVEQGLMKPFYYFACSDNTIELCREAIICSNVKTKSGEKEKIKGLDYNNSEDFVRDILAEFNRNKWICFFYSYEDLIKTKTFLRKLFPGYKFYEIHTYTDEQFDINEINSQEKAIILSMDMLLEGVHLKGIGGAMLFRNISSIPVFRQVLGRLTSINSDKDNPVVLDFSYVAYRMLWKLNEECTKDREGHEYAGRNPINKLFNVHINNKKIINIMSLLSKLQYVRQNRFELEGIYYAGYNDFCEKRGYSKRMFELFRCQNNYTYLDDKAEVCRKFIEYADRDKFNYDGVEYLNVADFEKENKLRDRKLKEFLVKHKDEYTSIEEGVDLFFKYLEDSKIEVDDIVYDSLSDFFDKMDVSSGGYYNFLSTNNLSEDGKTKNECLRMYLGSIIKYDSRYFVSYRPLCKYTQWDEKLFEIWRQKSKDKIKGKSMTEIVSIYEKYYLTVKEKEIIYQSCEKYNLHVKNFLQFLHENGRSYFDGKDISNWVKYAFEERILCEKMGVNYNNYKRFIPLHEDLVKSLSPKERIDFYVENRGKVISTSNEDSYTDICEKEGVSITAFYAYKRRLNLEQEYPGLSKQEYVEMYKSNRRKRKCQNQRKQQQV